jgi:peroxiredoxin
MTLLIMKTKQINASGKSSLKNLALVTALTSLNIFFMTPCTNASKVAEKSQDTIRLVAGVPSQPQDISPLLTGENIPSLNLVDVDGQSFDLNAAVASKPTILIFYRGGWCPYCSKQLAGLQEIQQDLSKMGYQILAVSTDSPDNLRKSQTKEKLTYKLLSDADLAASKQFGIAYKSPVDYDKFLPVTSGGKNIDKLLPVPSVFILNKQGNIRFEYINPNFTERLSPKLLKAIAAALYAEL